MSKAQDWLLAEGDGLWAIPEKPKQGDRDGWGHRFSRDIKERACGNSRSQLKSEASRARDVHEKLMEFPWVLVFDLWNLQQREGFPLSQWSQGKSGNLVEDKGKSEKLEIFWKIWKRQRRTFLAMQIFNINKKIIWTQKCMQLNCIWQSVVYMMLLFASTTLLRWFNISNPFYFNLSEVGFHLDQERKLYAINCVVSLLRPFLVV